MTNATIGLDTAQSILPVIEKNTSGRILKKIKIPQRKLVFVIG